MLFNRKTVNRAARGLLLLAATFIPSALASAQTPANVRVVNGSARVMRWFPHVPSDVVAVVEAGTTLEVLDREGAWYWVVAPRNAHGTRAAGWIEARNVEAVNEAPGAQTRSNDREDVGAAPSVPAQQPSVAPPSVSVENATNVHVPRNDYQFEDVQFARNRYSLSEADTGKLDHAASVLKDDPLLKVNIEGYTCNLGTAAYNLALGDRRASAVKDYLMSKGVAAERLRTISYGEERPKYDNTREDTRRLNRRVSIVPDIQP